MQKGIQNIEVYKTTSLVLCTQANTINPLKMSPQVRIFWLDQCVKKAIFFIFLHMRKYVYAWSRRLLEVTVGEVIFFFR